jgi:hypothetical protein
MAKTEFVVVGEGEAGQAYLVVGVKNVKTVKDDNMLDIKEKEIR